MKFIYNVEISLSKTLNANMKKHNLHNHSTFSDGLLRPEMIIEKAQKGGLKIIGISDHAYTQKLADKQQLSERFDEYISKLRKLQKETSEIKLLIGVEIDSSFIFPSKLPFKVLNQLDYVLFEYVNDIEFFAEITKIRKKIEIPVGLAHNDLQGNFSGIEEKITDLLSEFDIFLDINQSEDCRNCRKFVNYYELFSPELLMLLYQKKIKVVIGTDSHTGDAICEIQDAYNFIVNNGLTPHPMIC